MEKRKVKEIFDRFHSDRYNPASEHYRFEHFWDALQALQSQPAIGSGAEPVGLGTYYESAGRFGGATFDKDDMDALEKHGPPKGLQFHRLYTHPAPTAQDSKVPEAWIELLQGIVNELSIMDDSQGVAGLHLNGEISSWDEGDLPYLRDRAASMLSAAYSISDKPDHTEQPLAMVAEKPQLSAEDLQIIRQWYNCVSDLNPKYLNNDGFDDASVIRKVSALIDDGLQRQEETES